MGHLSLRLHNASLSQSATPVTPSRPTFCYTSVCRPAIWQEQTGKGSRCEQHCVTLIVCRTLSQPSAYAQCVYDGKDVNQLLKEVESLIELACFEARTKRRMVSRETP